MSKRRSEERKGPAALAAQGKATGGQATSGRATAGSPRQGATPPVSWRERYRRFVTPYLAAILSALLLSLALPPLNLSWMAYVALVPLLVMARAVRSPRQVFRAAWVGGVFFFGLNLRWLLVTGKSMTEGPDLFSWQVLGWALLTVYLGFDWAVFGWAFRRIGDALRLPATVLAPVLWVALEFIRGWLLTGFPWILAAHTQYANLVLIQTADLVGAYGASFLIAMTAGLVTDLLSRPLFVVRPGAARRFSPLLLGMIVLNLAAWAGTIGYGVWRLGEVAAERRWGPAVGAVQTCVPQVVKQEARHGSKDAEQEMLDDQILRTRQVVGEARQAGEPLDLLVWPETMVPGIMNQEFLESDLARKIDREQVLLTFEYFQERSRDAWRRIQTLTGQVGTPILYGAGAAEIEGVQRLPGGRAMASGPRRNSAFLMTPGLEHYAAAHAYSKVHLVPFGEYVPFKESWPWLRQQIMVLSPYDFDWTVTPGDPGQTPFEIEYGLAGEGQAPAGKATARFQVAICYEDAMAYRIRDMVRSPAPGRPKAIDFLVNISNDAWFNGSIELDQHLNLCVFRAIENRVPIVRSVNSGISAIIQSDGRIERPVTDARGNRRFIAGQTFGRLLLDRRVTVYTRIGDVFAKACLASAAVALVWALVRDRRNRMRNAECGMNGERQTADRGAF